LLPKKERVEGWRVTEFQRSKDTFEEKKEIPDTDKKKIEKGLEDGLPVSVTGLGARGRRAKDGAVSKTEQEVFRGKEGCE